MKGGKTPIHIQRWAPADYHEDEHVKLLKARRDYRTLTFYRHFIDRSFAAGGDLPADPEALAAVVEMPRRDVEHALGFCLGRLIEQDGDRLVQKRVAREVAEELEFREAQAERGRAGGRAGGKGRQKQAPNTGLTKEWPNPPAPSAKRLTPAPSPAPAPTPDNGSSGPPSAAGPIVPEVLKPKAWSTEACDDWIERFGGTAPGGQIGKALKLLVDRHGWASVRAAWRTYLAQTEARFASPSRFASTFASWLGGGARASPVGDDLLDEMRAGVMGGLRGDR